MGIPPNDTLIETQINALPLAAYQCIYNEYYRDQNLIAPVNYKLVDGYNSTPELLIMRKRAWEHDYFTASLPFAQKGTAVDIPIGQIENDVPVYLDATSGYPNPTNVTSTTGANIPIYTQSPDGSIGSSELFANTTGLQIQPGTINDLRRAMRLQEWLEKNARGGTRYVENILTHFGVKSSDARL